MDRLIDITRKIVTFRDKRSWSKFHTPRHLVAALSIEASELQEALLWKSDQEISSFARSRRGKRILHEEIADVLILSLLFCHTMNIEPISAIKTKLKQNAKKYPIKLSKGNATKYTDLKRSR